MILPAPVLRALAVACVAMIASALLPVKPFDGGYVQRPRTEWLITIALAAATVIIELRWLVTAATGATRWESRSPARRSRAV